jgi:hypothetical protein
MTATLSQLRHGQPANIWAELRALLATDDMDVVVAIKLIDGTELHGVATQWCDGWVRILLDHARDSSWVNMSAIAVWTPRLCKRDHGYIESD